MPDRDPIPTAPDRPPADPDSTGPHDNLPDTTPPNPVAQAAVRRDSDDGRVIAGKYHLILKIGEGGMGSVWRADQTHPVRRPVAVKLIRGGVGSAAAVARFEAERQALALMDHPHVAKVLDAGATDAGDPFFVMEVVPGVSLTRFCDEKQLPLRQRLELFIQVCQAVQHAHQRGIIHRDLKPGNILVEDRDGTPVPKVIDFGLAKALGGVALTDRPDQTRFGVMMGTPLYMAPEQAGGDPADVDTRADIYALGVILYELLTGTTPLDRGRLARMDLTELLQAIRQEEPPAPSSRLTEASTIAGAGATTMGFRRSVRGELDWITMKALAKERDQRYASASALAEDVGRYLRHEPVDAGPPSVGYRARKFVRRNRGAVAAGGLLLLTLAAGVVGTTAGMLRAQAANEESQKRLRWAEKGNEVLVSAFYDLDPRFEEKGGPPLGAQLGDRLDRAAALLEEETVGDPLTMARLQNALGLAQLNLGYPERAELLFARAAATRAEQLGPEHVDTLEILSNRGRTLRMLGRVEEAIRVHEPVLHALEKQLGADHQFTITSRNNLALAMTDVGRLDEAAALLARTIQLSAASLGDDHPETLNARNNLALTYLEFGRPADAARLDEETLRLSEARHGPNHVDTLMTRSNLASAYKMLGRLEDSLRLDEETLRRYEAKLGPDHLDTLNTRNNLGVTYIYLGRVADAAALLERTLGPREVKLGPDHIFTIKTRNNLAGAYLHLNRPADAARLLEQTLKTANPAIHSDHPDALSARHKLAVAYDALGEPARAEPLHRDAAAIARKLLGPDNPQTSIPLLDWASNLVRQQKWTDAEPVLRECLAMCEKIQPDGWVPFAVKAQLGGSQLGQKKYADAEPLLKAGYSGLKARAKSIPPANRVQLRDAGERLARLYEATNRSAEAAKLRSELPPTVAPRPRAAK